MIYIIFLYIIFQKMTTASESEPFEHPDSPNDYTRQIHKLQPSQTYRHNDNSSHRPILLPLENIQSTPTKPPPITEPRTSTPLPKESASTSTLLEPGLATNHQSMASTSVANIFPEGTFPEAMSSLKSLRESTERNLMVDLNTNEGNDHRYTCITCI